MQPVLVLQHLSSDGPAALGRWLGARGVRLEVRNTEARDVYPESIDGHRALAVLDGEMSAKDDLPSLRRAEALILQAVQRGIPVLGDGVDWRRAFASRVPVAQRGLCGAPGAIRLVGNASCPNQAFAIGPHLALQFHLELDEEKLRRWAANPSPGTLDAQRRWPTVHPSPRLLHDAEQALPAQLCLADQVYTRWLAAAPD